MSFIDNGLLEPTDIIAYVIRAIAHDTRIRSTNLHIGFLPNEVEQYIKDKFGIDVHGAQVRLTTSYVKHSLKKHGTAQEHHRGQIPIVPLEFGFITAALRQGRVTLGKYKGANPILLFEYEENHHYTFRFELLSTKQGLILDLNTFHKRPIKKPNV